jgi:hypothetical protein
MKAMKGTTKKEGYMRFWKEITLDDEMAVGVFPTREKRKNKRIEQNNQTQTRHTQRGSEEGLGQRCSVLF